MRAGLGRADILNPGPLPVLRCESSDKPPSVSWHFEHEVESCCCMRLPDRISGCKESGKGHPVDALWSPSGLFILCRFVRLLCEARFHTLLQKLRGISHAQKCLVNCLSIPFTSLFCRQSHNRAETANSRFLKPAACQSFVHFIGRDEKLHGEQRSRHCVSPLCLAAVSGHGCGKATLSQK